MRRSNPSSVSRGQRWLAFLACGTCVTFPLALGAATEPADALEEVVVTAQRRSERLQEVPVAVTALSGAELQARQLRDLSELQQVVPGMAVWPILANSATATISLRGQVEFDLLPTYDPAVGVYLDGVYIARATGANLDFIDMERVETLRGPQGTLFGRNTTGGAINLVTQKPLPTLQGSLEARLGNYDFAELTGMLNLPLDAVGGAMRAVARHSEHSGYGRSLLVGHDLSDENSNYLRTRLALPLDEYWSLDLTADVTDEHNSGQLMTLVAAFPPDDQIPALVGNPADTLDHYIKPRDGNVWSNRVGSFRLRIWGIAATALRQAQAWTLTSITGYRDLRSAVRNADLDGTPYDLGAVVARDQNEHQFSEEIQLHGNSERLGADWVLGALYFAESADFHGHGLGPVPLSTVEGMLGGVANNQSAAVYADAIFRLSTRTRAHAGLRYNLDWRQLVSQNAALVDGVRVCVLDPSVVDDPAVCSATLPKRQFAYVPFSIGLDWLATPDVFAYGKISRGQRAGGYNMRGSTDTSLMAFDPEYVISYELGVKADLASHRLRTNVAAYYTDFRDVQVGLEVPDPVVGTSFVKANGGHARIQGLEGEFTALLHQLRLSASIGLTDGRYLWLAPNVEGLTDNSPLGLPRLTWSVSVEAPFHTTAGDLTARADFGHHSTDSDDVFRDRCRCTNAYGVANALISLSTRSRVVYELWARNVTNTRYMAQWVDGGDFINAVPGDPRTYGVYLSYAFGDPH